MPHLVGVLEDEVLALVQLAADIDDAAEDPPGVLHAQVDLAGELVGFELLRAQDDVASGVLHVVARHIPEEEDDDAVIRRRWRKPARLKLNASVSHPSFRYSDPASMAQQVQRASL